MRNTMPKPEYGFNPIVTTKTGTDRLTIAEYRQQLANKPTKSGKRSKYNALKTVTDGITFDSKKEANRYQALKLLQKAGEIGEIVLQYPFTLPGGITYRCDFLYYDRQAKAFIVEDCKGFRTPEYKLKKKLMKECLGIEIVES